MSKMNYHVFDSSQQVVEALAKSMQEYSELGRPVHISLSGGSTPSQLFSFLAASAYATSINWQNLHFWWGDERCVAPEDEQSNYGQAKALLFDHIEIPAQNIHRIRGEEFAATEVTRFAEEMLDVIPHKDGVPEFDWILLGMGTDGHTASLFPGQTDYESKEIAIIAAHPESRQIRVSKSAHLLAHAKRITYLVLGASKAPVIKEIAEQAPAAEQYPAAKVIAKDGITEWYLDSEAAKELA
ncbi:MULTISPECIES: 6-phosphogluconolactonase [Photobacterium]|uniref:6-phosphogluconolactonase n=1 Tax=Photobacterium ganghwense TaxID=320778 RepID=A0A0J1KB96_9GAMM|nr:MULTISPECIES: 6-phosphogluconolactonase [Photobacterium]KLV11602.1 6-phosphogluconolactonase [Photobacterium ganghwense]MBV1840982.1 6-phosphogluconolactonase [Photobacterium ganghwense]PSU08475.1 6-phosphogluconolactonase [Photobacterium ganghwense]QSV15282.1 6-phosphogluconolactonase [Photobacterium ganghwense]